MKVGSIVYATDQGLGVLARSFYDSGIVTDVLVMEHGKRKNHHHWYPLSAKAHLHGPERQHTLEFCASMDAMLFFETPFDWELIPYCHSRGVVTILMPMYECMPDPLPHQPKHLLCPSTLDLKHFPTGTHLPIPVPNHVKFKPRKQAKVFVHNAGHGGLRGRNGTGELLDAMKYVKADIKLILRTQEPLKWGCDDLRVEVRVGTVPAEELYDEGDVFVFPEKFNGLSLPLQEAFASGMLVMATDRKPMNEWLPNQPLITPKRYVKSRVAGRCRQFDEAEISPKDIAHAIDDWYQEDIRKYSYMGEEYGRKNSWAALRSLYIDYIVRCVVAPRKMVVKPKVTMS